MIKAMISNDSRKPETPAPSPSPASGPDMQGYSTFPLSKHLRNLAHEQEIREHRNQLLAQIRENPGSDEARLAYGNHLLEKPLSYRDEARGELIRLQIERGSGAPSPREIEILQKYERTWCKELGGARGIEWDRGFVTGVTMSAAAFEKAGHLLANELVSHLRIHVPGGSEDGGYDLRDALRAPHFATIQKLSFWFGDARAIEVLELTPPSCMINLRQVHFEQFADSREAIMEAVKGVRAYGGSLPHGSNALSFNDVAITFKTIEEGSRCYFGTSTTAKVVAE